MCGGSSGGYIPSPRAGFDCEIGVITTNVSSVDLNVLATHSVGDILDVLLQDNIVVLENGNGEILGSVLHVNIRELKECIKRGNGYEAVITSINNTQCKVKISNKRL
jgi:hypothetical protein